MPTANYRHIFAENSVLTQHIPSFKPRTVQQEMADAVTEALDDHRTLVVEAGTGTGKTFAYLIPAILSGKKIIISTGTKNLQDQLYHRDLPLLKKALNVPFSIAILKGRKNYLCRYRMEKYVSDGRLPSKEIAAQFLQIVNNEKNTQLGETAEFSDIPEDSPVWYYATSTNDNCLSTDCSHYNNCYILQARKKALKAEVLIINHHLFFADLVLREKGFGELLPGADAIIFDEAHQLAETAMNFFGSSISSRQLLELARDTQKEITAFAKDMREISDKVTLLQKNVADLRLCFPRELIRKPWLDISGKPQLIKQLNQVNAIVDDLKQLLEVAAPRSKGLENCWARCVDIAMRFKLLTGETPLRQIHWFETHSQTFTIHLTPLDVANEFHQQVQALNCAKIFTSATLAVKNDFQYFTKQMGLQDATCLQLPSTYDYATNTRLYVPINMPDPMSDTYLNANIQAAIPVIKAAKGRTFFLFTSHYALRQAYDRLITQIHYPILMQGQMPKTKLLEKFRALGNAVLLATSSFWEGVDVKGEALSCVIIDKLPFASPSDPILKAQIAAIKNEGGDPFNGLQLNHAVIALKQGAGRLIRDESDRGVLMICDPRIISKPYGKAFLGSLPPMPITRSLSDIETFLANQQHEIVSH